VSERHNKKQMKPKKCKFHAACGRMATTKRYHTFLKRVLEVCDHCAGTNEYLVEWIDTPETV
jgi:DnaJ-class molecular chaperone